MSRTFQLLLLLMLARIVKADAAYKNVTDGPHSCGGMDIPYPSGIVDDNGNGEFLSEAFGVGCDAGKPTLATYAIGNFSIQKAEARVWLPVAWQCYNLSGVGNGTVGLLRGKPLPDPGNSSLSVYTQFTGCIGYCNDIQSAVNGVCSGVGCCHAEVMSDLTDSSVDFVGGMDFTNSINFSACDYAFLAEDYYTFQVADLNMDLHLTPRLMPVRLDWAIRDSPTCKEATKKEGYACISSNSSCIDYTNGPGYLCNCSVGYEGNPYIVDGCTDINECEHLDHYPCEGDCKNKQGSYECTCPKNSHSEDPLKKPCIQKFALNAKIITGTLGGILIIAIMVFIFLLRKEKRKMRDYFEKNGGSTLEKLNNLKLFKKSDIKKIMKSSNIIGKGGFGKVYKGRISGDNQLVAVKEPINKANNDQFANEIKIQSRVIHKNIVKLIGCCLEVHVPILVYEFVPKGSLDDILHGNNIMHLSMGQRLKIAAGLAEGLAYMHSKTATTILHGDVKPANILLHDDFVPKISDFGISRLIVTDMLHTGRVIGDTSYMDPVYFQKGLLTKKSDVYSFGVVLLELITRKKASHFDKDKLLQNFLDAYAENKPMIELVDKELAEEYDIEIIHSLTRMINECLNLDVSQRPEMTDLAERLHDMVKSFHGKYNGLPNDLVES
ncbi:hypothetical protein ACQ4PT_038939 [Festuca glaucescens]